MCGIFGILSNQSQDNLLLHQLAMKNINRGNNGFGFLSIDNYKEIIFRSDISYNDKLFNYVQLGNLVCCHLLASTGSEKRIHPFETDRFVFAHNGILINHLDYSQWYLGPIDSQYILGGIKYFVEKELFSVSEAIVHTNEKLNGQKACWLWDKIERQLYLWRVMSPLYLFQIDDILGFSSHPMGDLIEEGRIYRIDYQTHEVFIEQKFNFYSPYLVV